MSSEIIDMTYFADLSDYIYLPECIRSGTRNIGWLELGHDFDKAQPSEKDLNVLLEFCKISIAQTRGVHTCSFCGNAGLPAMVKNESNLLLGTSEIRVFSANDIIYSAPTLLYHYMSVHHYRPPDEFLIALRNGPRPLMEGYFRRLNNIKLEWTKTSKSDAAASIFRFDELPE